jgi:hypothetical protein
MEARPRLKLNLSRVDKILEVTGQIVLLILWVLTLYAFFKLPTIIPTHYNASGQVDNFGKKSTLLILPILATAIYFGLTLLNKYPHILNYMNKITEADAIRQYTIATRMLRFIKLSILLIFSLIVLFIYLTTIGVTKGLGRWFLPLTAAFLLVPIILSIFLSFRKGAP